MKLVGLSILALFQVAIANAAEISSQYTKLDLENGCIFTESHEQGGSATCKGYQDYPVYFSEGDLRQQVRFGFVNQSDDSWETFGEFNSVNETIEWRLQNGNPFAAIQRWFISIADPETGEFSDATNGNILVVSTVATKDKPQSCIIGYVDTRANANANVLARNVADILARYFRCGEDRPRFHGLKSNQTGTPTNYIE